MAVTRQLLARQSRPPRRQVASKRRPRTRHHEYPGDGCLSVVNHGDHVADTTGGVEQQLAFGPGNLRHELGDGMRVLVRASREHGTEAAAADAFAQPPGMLPKSLSKII